jgi:hypothetical protein
MQPKFLMTQGTTLSRKASNRFEPTELTEGLFRRLVALSMKTALGFYSDFFQRSAPVVDDALLDSYLPAFQEALGLGLFRGDGIAEKNHVSFWCLSKVLDPRVYIESGVFTGSSLHAFLRGVGQCKIIAIDPHLGNLKIPREMLGDTQLVADQDFSQITLDIGAGDTGVVYFDDHIDTANRIQQTCAKGLRYLLIDDSTGFEGICQRLYPAVPTIPIILNADDFSVGDYLSWSFPQGNGTFTRTTLQFDEALLERCREARRRIRRCEKIPDLGDFLPQVAPDRTVNTTKYLLELDLPR